MGFLNNFWDFLWMFLTIFVFIVYMFAVFAIISDLFRDHGQSGWAKALWIMVLIGLPFVGPIAYLIARGSGMAERQRAAQEAGARGALVTSAADEIAKAKALLDSGTITVEEFNAIKARVTQ
ncbi:MAG TPA: SHOCT domain-containing protein [Microbacteriaceae bacterium]|nr:SHOCT domain-containing protein [Microbacteriaceae bacterium]